MTDISPVETTNLKEHGDRRLTQIEWSTVCEVLAAPPPPDTPGGHLASFLGTVRPDGRPHATGVGARWYDGDLYFLSGPGTRKSRNLVANPACTIAMRLPDGLDLVLEGEAAPSDDPTIRQAGWPVEVAAGGFTAPFGPSEGGSPPWRLYRFVFHTAIGQGDEGGARWRFAR